MQRTTGPRRIEYVEDGLIRLAGWRGALLNGDPPMWDRGRWLRQRIVGGPLRTLDAGSGNGALSFLASRLGNEVVALSFDERSNLVARRRAELLDASSIRFETCDLRELDLLAPGLGTFHQIICFETIEHILDEEKLVRDLTALLRPEGRLLLTTPYLHHHPMVDDRVTEIEDGGHVRYGSTHDRLTELFEAAGLEVTELSYLTGVISQKINNLMRLLAKRIGWKAAWALTLPLRPLTVGDAALTRATNWPHLCVGIVGVRRAS